MSSPNSYIIWVPMEQKKRPYIRVGAKTFIEIEGQGP